MAKEVTCGLVLGAGCVEWVRLDRGKDRNTVEEQKSLTVPAAGDEAEDSRVELLREECVPGHDGVVLGLPTDQVLMRTIELPAASDEELVSMVDLQVDKFSPFPMDEMVVTYEVLQREGTQMLVLVAAVQRTVVDAAAKILDAAGLTPERIDVAGLGRWRMLSERGDLPEDGRHMRIFWQSGGMELFIFEGKTPLLVRTAMADPSLRGGDLVSELASEVLGALMSLELGFGEGALASCAVWVEPGTLPLSVPALEGASGVSVDVRDVGDQPLGAEGLVRRASGRGEARIDLTPASWRAAVDLRVARKRLVLVTGVLLGVWLLLLGAFLGALFLRERKVADLQLELDRWREPAMEVRETRRRVLAIRRYMDRSASALECLREVSVGKPPGVELSSFSYRKGESVRIAGQAGVVSHVYSYKQELDGSELFTDAVLQGPTRNERLRKELFDIELALPKEEQ